MSFTTALLVFAILTILIMPTLKDRTIPVSRLLIMPALFCYLTYQTITENFHAINFNMFSIGMMAGVGLGLIMRSNTPIRVDKTNGTISLPGSVINLLLFIVIFAIHYVIGYLEAVHPDYFISENVVSNSLLFALSCACCVSVGMNACLFYKYESAK